MSPVTLPDRPDALRAVAEGRANPVEVFVANFEYTGSDPTMRAAWCSQLLDALESVRGTVGDVEVPRTLMVERAARAMMDGSLWKGAFENALMYGGQEAERDVWRDYARRALAAINLPARDARMHRAGMEAMRERAVAAVKGERLHEKPDNDSDEAYNCAICHAAAAVGALPLDPTPASAMAGGEA